MGFIEDDSLFKAVSFASSMIKKGISVGLAVHKAANYYDVERSKVASELGKRGAKKSKYNRNKSNDFYAKYG